MICTFVLSWYLGQSFFAYHPEMYAGILINHFAPLFIKVICQYDNYE